jgi:hypothetical protein
MRLVDHICDLRLRMMAREVENEEPSNRNNPFKP